MPGRSASAAGLPLGPSLTPIRPRPTAAPVPLPAAAVGLHQAPERGRATDPLRDRGPGQAGAHLARRPAADRLHPAAVRGLPRDGQTFRAGRTRWLRLLPQPRRTRRLPPGTEGRPLRLRRGQPVHELALRRDRRLLLHGTLGTASRNGGQRTGGNGLCAWLGRYGYPVWAAFARAQSRRRSATYSVAGMGSSRAVRAVRW